MYTTKTYLKGHRQRSDEWLFSIGCDTDFITSTKVDDITRRFMWGKKYKIDPSSVRDPKSPDWGCSNMIQISPNTWKAARTRRWQGRASLLFRPNQTWTTFQTNKKLKLRSMQTKTAFTWVNAPFTNVSAMQSLELPFGLKFFL